MTISGPHLEPIDLEVNGNPISVTDPDQTLLGVLRGQLGLGSVKDGCSPQGQCGCCTVLVDGKPRVACVTPIRRLRGRSVITLEGLDPDRRQAWAEAFTQCGATQCGFCTPGIIVRLDATKGLAPAQASAAGDPPIGNALAAHQCRCTGWQTILEAWDAFDANLEALNPSALNPSALNPSALAPVTGSLKPVWGSGRDWDAAATRAQLEGRAPQLVGHRVALGQGGFAGDTAPPGALVAVPSGSSTGAGRHQWDSPEAWVVADTLVEARRQAHKIQGRRTTAPEHHPIDLPPGEWAKTLRTSWVEPAYLEPDTSWCEPGAEPVSAGGNGGAFGAKSHSPLPQIARALADQHGQPVLAVASREDVARWTPKRPPVGAGVDSEGGGIMRIGAGLAMDQLIENVRLVAPDLVVEPVTIPGPPVSGLVRGAGWVEALVLLAGARGATGPLRSPDGAVAEAAIADDGTIKVLVSCGPVLDEIDLRSYCVGAAHMAWSWLTSESLTVANDGTVLDLTMRSFGVLKAIDTPRVEVEIDHHSSGDPVNGSDAVFAAVAAAAWLELGCSPKWPIKERQ